MTKNLEYWTSQVLSISPPREHTQHHYWSFRVKIGLKPQGGPQADRYKIYKWSHKHYKWRKIHGFHWGYFTLLILSSRGAPCAIQMIFGSRSTRPKCWFPSQYLKPPTLIPTTTLITFRYTGCLRGILISWLIVGRISSPQRLHIQVSSWLDPSRSPRYGSRAKPLWWH